MTDKLKPCQRYEFWSGKGNDLDAAGWCKASDVTALEKQLIEMAEIVRKVPEKHPCHFCNSWINQADGLMVLTHETTCGWFKAKDTLAELKGD